MADPKIKVKRSSVPEKIPTTAQLEAGEFAINTYDGKVYIQQDQGGVGVGTTVIAVNPWSVGIGTNTYNTYFISGDVGIGTINPTSKLYVAGNGYFTGIVTALDFRDINGNSISGSGSGSGISSIGISSNSTSIGTATTLNFTGTAISSISISSGVASINIIKDPQVSIGTNIQDIFDINNGEIRADDLSEDRLYGWDESANKAIGFALSSHLGTDGTNIKVNTAASSVAGLRVIAISTLDPTGGSDGDVWIKYTP